MKVEPRGKFGGIKIHLDAGEVQPFLSLWTAHHMTAASLPPPPQFVVVFALSLGKKASRLLKEFPDLLQDKSEEQIKAELQLELDKSTQKLAKMAAGTKWDHKEGIQL